ncbi:MAG TPA: hypothetical protein VF293_04370 [Candidatus Limnocylindrales bacterium]
MTAGKSHDVVCRWSHDVVCRWSYLRWHNRNARPAKPWRFNAEVHHSLPNVAA